MTEESSTASHLSAAMTTEEANKADRSTMTSLSLSSDYEFYFKCAVVFIGVASHSRRDAGFTIRPNDGKNKSLYFINFITK